MDVKSLVEVLFRWMHILMGIVWIGMLYFFNWVNGPFTATMDAETKKKVVPELMPRALFWFRMGAAFTWITGILLIGMVFQMTTIALEHPETGWTGLSYLILWSFLITPFIYDALAKSPLGKNLKVFAAVCYVLVIGMICLYINAGGFSYRGMMIETGAMLGTIMAYNVWFRIWPAQKQIIMGVKTGNPADASLVAMAGARSKMNTYMSFPLVWTMINAHSAFLAGEYGWAWLAGIILVSWLGVMQMYKRAGKVKGF